METILNICCVKGEGAVDHSTVTKWLKKFHTGCKKFDNQARSGMLVKFAYNKEDTKLMLTVNHIWYKELLQHYKNKGHNWVSDIYKVKQLKLNIAGVIKRL